jgi:hypothetical protein
MNAMLEEPKVQSGYQTDAEMFGKVREKFPKIKGLQRKIKFLWRTDDNLGATPEEAKKALKVESNPAYYFRVDYYNPDNHYIEKSLFVMATRKKVVDLTKVSEPRVDKS